MQAMNDAQLRHRVLGGISRSRLLSVLRRAGQPMGVRELADAVDLHPNTAREGLDQLVAAGLVTRERSRPSGRGRPSLRYAAVQDENDAEAYRVLAGVLAGELARRPDAVDAAATAGERWGHAMANGSQETPRAADAVDRLVDLLDQAGFAPEAATGPGEPIRLRRCPFRSLARERGEVVCGVHLGLMRGALRELGAPLDAVRLEPFVEPNLCLAHLEPLPHG